MLYEYDEAETIDLQNDTQNLEMPLKRQTVRVGWFYRFQPHGMKPSVRGPFSSQNEAYLEGKQNGTMWDGHLEVFADNVVCE